MPQGVHNDVEGRELNSGPLRIARFLKPFAVVTAGFACAQPGGSKLVGRFDRLPLHTAHEPLS
ncbi:hypothetical protein [Jiella marina]|uniref:hypothetical protein n=1 Tax=Jiella sp. LLJ827 TaxID=2917712 RepID=UPI00210096D3|nr:hypothetical protein [Jiella sp. LLJ827]MCQ0986953.1 hypothetical protein [Jiella sp. LLJ827]